MPNKSLQGRRGTIIKRFHSVDSAITGAHASSRPKIDIERGDSELFQFGSLFHADALARRELSLDLARREKKVMFCVLCRFVLNCICTKLG